MKLRNWIWNNPVVVKEIRTRMRGSRAFWLVSLHLLLVTLIIGLVYAILLTTLAGGGNIEARRYLGKGIFGLLVALELATISFTAPALTASMISSERERQTFDLLRVTHLAPTALVSGKFLSGLSFVFLLLVTSIPLQGPAFMIGGIAPVEIAVSILVLLSTAIAFCALGIFFSSYFRRTLAATVSTYAVSILLVFGIPLIAFILLIAFTSSLSSTIEPPPPIITAVLVFIGWLVISITPLGSLLLSEFVFIDQRSVWLYTLDLPKNTQMTLVSPWVIYVFFSLVMSGLLLWASVHLVRRLDQ